MGPCIIILQHEVMVVDEWHNNGPQDLVTVSLCIQNAINKMHLCSLSTTYACPYHNPTATMGHSIHNIDISKPLTQMTPYTHTFVYIEKVLDLWVQLMKNGGKNKSVAFIILVSIYSGKFFLFDPLLILYVCPLTKKLSVCNFNGRFIWTVRDRITTKKSRKTHFKKVINWFAF